MQPKVLIADEPTTALDVTIQAQILDTHPELQRKLGTAVLLITHDLGVVAETAQRVIVMYAGAKVEEARCGELFAHPLHPYTRGLMASIPRIIPSVALADRESEHADKRLAEIPGMVRRSPTCRRAAYSRRVVLSRRTSVARNIRHTRRNGPAAGPPAGAPMRFMRRRMPDRGEARHAAATAAAAPVLQVQDLKKHFVIHRVCFGAPPDMSSPWTG